MRRQLVFNHLDQAIAECESLQSSGYTKGGNWSLAQICFHMRTTIEANMNGYPTWMVMLGYPLRPFLRWFMLPKLLAGDSPSGVKTAGKFVPADDLKDEAEVAALRQCVATFLQCNEPLHAHPGFGNMSREEFNHFHAAHAAHHLSFLHPEESKNRGSLDSPPESQTSNAMTPFTQSIQTLIDRREVAACKPAKPEEIAAFEQSLGREIPASLREYLLYCNGLSNIGIPPQLKVQLDFASIDSLTSYADPFDGWPFLADLGLLLILDANDSNPICIITQGPLTGMVAHIFHDGETCLRFESLEDMFLAFAEGKSVEESYDSQHARTLPPKSMTSDLNQAYDQLLELRDGLDDDYDGLSLLMCFALDLCADSEVDKIAYLLQEGDEYVRERALKRLAAIESEEAQSVIRADTEAFESFKQSIERRGSPDRVRTLNWPMLFVRRHEADFEDWIKRLLGEDQ